MNVLKKQRIKSLIEQGGYADKPEPSNDSCIWKWLTGVAVTSLLGYLTIDLLL